MPSLSIRNITVNVSSGTILSLPGVIIIPEGSRVAVLGENGAGKTTLFNCILGQRHFSGTVTPRITPQDAAIVLQRNSYAEFIRTDELIQLVIGESRKSRKYQDILQDFKLHSCERKMVSTLSGGENQRLTLALALHAPKEFYFFDEISSGLDYQNRQELAHLVQQKTGDKTVLSISHYFEEVQNWATHILLLHHGKLKYFGTTEKLYETYPHDTVLEFPAPISKLLDESLLKGYAHSDAMVFCPMSKIRTLFLPSLKLKESRIKSAGKASPARILIFSGMKHPQQRKHTHDPIFTDVIH